MSYYLVEFIPVHTPQQQQALNQLILLADCDIDHESPAALKILYRIAVSSETLSTYVFEVTPRKAIERGAIDTVRLVLTIERVIKGWQGPPLREDSPPLPCDVTIVSTPFGIAPYDLTLLPRYANA